MTMGRYIRAIAGSFVLLTHFVSRVIWLLLTTDEQNHAKETISNKRFRG